MTARYPDLAGKGVVITGGADGIGRACAEAFAEQRARVAILDIDAAKGQALVQSLARRVPVAFEAIDLRDLDALANVFGKLASDFDAIDILVNNAGHDERHPFADVTPAYWDERMAVNLRHMMFCAQAVAPGMRARKSGVIVNLSSTSWMQGAPNLIAYTTAKSAVIGFTRSLARDLGVDGIRVNAVTPGWVMTDRQRAAATPERLAAQQAKQSIKGEIAPHDIAAMILFLASDEARMCTGQNFIVDGGTV